MEFESAVSVMVNSEFWKELPPMLPDAVPCQT